MITDLGRRNQARLCGQLGVGHIIVAADIRRKRRFIQKNVTAWLRKPDLGTVPLFMAGDKQYFYYVEKIRRQTGAPGIVYCANPLEKTDFKSGFCGVPPATLTNDSKVYALPLVSRFRLAAYYAGAFARNPAYLNASVIDTANAYLTYYFLPHDFMYLLQYIPWDEDEITTTLQQYGWERPSDSVGNWRIVDGTAALYNYIYRRGAEFTENDTFRSNQIREGVLTRERAMALVQADNQPRGESIQWYCEIIGIDFRDAIAAIQRMPRRY